MYMFPFLLFPSGRYRAKLIYEREMEHGHSNTDITKVVMIGIAGSGKSTALETIMEEEPQAEEDRDSTPIMKRPVKTSVIIVDGKMKWKRKEPEQFTEFLASQLSTAGSPPQDSTPQNVPSPQATPTDATPSLPDSASSDSSSHTPTSRPTPHSATGTATTAATVQPSPAPATELSVDSLLQSAEVEEEFISLINRASGSQKPALHERWVYLIDSGGQMQFQDAFSVFLTHTSACVFVFKLSEPLDSYPPIKYYRKGKLVGKVQQSILTNRDIFKQYMRTMHSFNCKAKGTDDRGPPRLLCLGTHRDLKFYCETETVEQKNEQLEAVIPDKLKEQVIYNEKKKLIFEINGQKPEDIDKKTAEEIRRCIMEKCPSRKKKTPWRWHLLHQKMRSIARRLGRDVLSREECWKIARSLRLDEESFERALEFFHDLSVIFYYPAILHDVVFVDPQVLLDKVTELVEFIFELQEDEDPSDKQPTRSLPLGWQKFDKFAQVTEEFLKDERFSSHYHEPTFGREHLTTLLEKLLVFARLSPNTWFMPCVLKHLTPQEIKKYCMSQFPLVVHFPDGGPQHGVCCSLIAHVLSTANKHPYAWKIRLASNDPACLYRNCIQFEVPKFGGFVMLIDRYMYFEVHVRTSRRKLDELWQHVRCAIFHGVESVSVTLGYSNNKPRPAILCPAHTETSHPAPIRDDEWICSSDCNEFGEVADLEGCIPWLEKSEDASAGELFARVFEIHFVMCNIAVCSMFKCIDVCSLILCDCFS